MPLTKNNLYSDNEVFCGGVGQQFKKNKGKCGVCGDDWSAKRPRLNENGGTWGTGTIGKTYFQGQVRITNYIYSVPASNFIVEPFLIEKLEN